MAKRIEKNWDRESSETLFERIGEKLHRTPPLKERVATAIYRLKLQQGKLEQASLKMQRHDKELFEKCVGAQMVRDATRASMYANECAEVRKMAKVILLSELALEQVVLRLETIEEFGDVAVWMGPVANIIHALKGRLAGVIPEVSYELGSIDEMLSSMVIEAGQATGKSYDIEVSGDVAKKVLTEAGAIADQKIKERFPELPSLGVPALPEGESHTSSV